MDIMSIIPRLTKESVDLSVNFFGKAWENGQSCPWLCKPQAIQLNCTAVFCSHHNVQLLMLVESVLLYSKNSCASHCKGLHTSLRFPRPDNIQTRIHGVALRSCFCSANNLNGTGP